MARTVGQHHGDLRRALLDAALELVRQGNAESLTLRGVARQAGVSSGAPYHHFSDKAALLGHVAREGFEQLAQVQDRVPAGEPGPRLSEMSAAYVRFAVEHRAHYQVMFARSPTQLMGEAREGLREVARQTFATLVGAVCAANPALTAEEGGRRGLLIWALAHGAVEVGRWSADLDPSFSVDVLAHDVGAQALAIALG